MGTIGERLVRLTHTAAISFPSDSTAQHLHRCVHPHIGTVSAVSPHPGHSGLQSPLPLHRQAAFQAARL